MANLAAAAILMSLFCTSSAYDFFVGGRGGWSPNPKESLNNWAARMRFQVNDNLVFRYPTNDSVLVVKKEDYDSCNVQSPIQKLEGGDSKFRFNRSGAFYFISGVESNCKQGEKLIVVVMSPRRPILPPPTPSPSSSPPPSKSPSPSASPIVPPSTSPSSPPSKAPAPSPSSPLPSPHSPSPSPSSSSSPSPSPSSPKVSPSPSPSISPSSSPSSSSPSPSPSSPKVSPSISPSSSPSSPSSVSPTPSTPSPSSSTPGGTGAAPAPAPKASSSSSVFRLSRLSIGLVVLVLAHVSLG